jgi:hypothetical protein
MGVGVSLVLIAAGAILAFAVNVSSQSVDWHTVGVILMVVGGISFVASLIFWGSWGGWYRRRTTYVEDRPVV